MDSNVFYIVPEELARLPENIRDAWKARLVPETLTAYETPEQLDARMNAVSYAKYPELKAQIDAYIEQSKQGKTPSIEFKNFPEEAIDSFLFSIGASGISLYIHLYLSDPAAFQNPNMMESIAALSRARHKILERNQSVFA